MSTELAPTDVRALRTQAQLLRRRRRLPPEEVAAAVCGLQAQNLSAGELSLGIRTTGLRAVDVQRAREVDRTLVRGWFMRGTLHLVATRDFGLLFGIYAPLHDGGGRLAHLGVSEAAARRGVDLIRRAVERDGPVPRPELTQRLEVGLRLQPGTQAPIHLLAKATQQGVICQGPGDSFVALRDWLDVDKPLPPEQAHAELARRYLGAFGPATLADFVSWSGLRAPVARTGWAAAAATATEVRVGGEAALLPRGRRAPHGGPVVRFLPQWDTSLLGYRSRALVVGNGDARRLAPGGGMLRAAVTSDGKVVGTWRWARRGDVDLDLFRPLPAEQEELLTKEIANVRAFRA